MTELNLMPLGEQEYNELLRQAVAVIDQARSSLAIQVNNTVANAYWNLGKLLTEKKLESKHGSGVVNRLSSDLRERFPDLGVSPRNLWDMKRFYLRYLYSDPKLRQAVAVLPWGHNLLMMNKNLSDEQTIFYAKEVISKSWSRDMLLHAVKGNYYENLIISTRPYLHPLQNTQMRCFVAVTILVSWALLNQ